MAASRVESWDDDLELEGPIRTTSASTAHGSLSFSSRLSLRSESNAGDEDWQVPLTPNDQESTSKAISSAKQAGIPIPSDVPSSALLGGSITRLGKKPSRRKLKDDWSEDLDIPDNVQGGLKVKPRPSEPVTPGDDFDDLDWANGSLGTRFGGTRRESKNNRSSSVSAVSPSMGSIMTLESEEDNLDGLIIPSGPLNLDAAIKKRQEPEKQPHISSPQQKIEQQTQPVESNRAEKDDFLDGIEFGEDVFDPRKKTLNRNIKQVPKPAKESTPVLNKVHTTLTFTDKSSATRIPRPIQAPRAMRLEPVYEAGATSATRPRRPEPTTTSAQLLRSKRSMPALRSHPTPASKPPPMPFLGQDAQQQHTPSRPSPYHGRRDSDPLRPQSPAYRATPSRLAAYSSNTPVRPRQELAPASLAREAATKRTITKPARRRNFGDGTELDTFDDLPTSAAKEKEFMKQPSTRPATKGLRTQQSQSRLAGRENVTTPQPVATPRSPTKFDNLPRFARDTAASRIAREQKLSSAPPRPRGEGVLLPRLNWAAQVAARTPQPSPTAHRAPRKGPQLVNHMGKENIKHFEDDAAKKGMRWNPSLCRWEGNDHVLLPFNETSQPLPLHPLHTPHHSQHSQYSQPPPQAAASSASPPRQPALITNITGGAARQGVQVVGGMVFDPQRMCWLKMAPGHASARSNPRSPSLGGLSIPAADDDDNDEDPFYGIEDLQDKPAGAPEAGTGGAGATTASATRPASVTSEWLVGEEFDLGPEFIRRQREEEATWRQRVGAWFPLSGRDAALADHGEAERAEQGRREDQKRFPWLIRDIAATVPL